MRQVTVPLLAVLVVVVAAILGLFLWLRTYAPIQALQPVTPGPGLGADVEPTFGSGGKPVFIPAYRPGRTFETTVTLRNGGRFGITVTGVEPTPSLPVSPEPASTSPVRLDPHETVLYVVRWRLTCRDATGEATADHVRVDYEYLSIFRRTESVELPFAVTLRCSGGPPATP